MPPDQGDAGYETTAVNIFLPKYESSGRDISFQEAEIYLVWGPPHPALVLEYAAPDDPALGVTYSSLAPGKIIVSNNVPSFP